MTLKELYDAAYRRKRYAILGLKARLTPESELKLFMFFEAKGFEFIARSGLTYYFKRKGVIWS